MLGMVVLIAVLIVAMVLFSEAKAAKAQGYKFFVGGWITAAVLFVSVIICVFAWFKTNARLGVAEQKNAQHESFLNKDYDSRFRANYGDAGKLEPAILETFTNGAYGYTIKYYERTRDISGYRNYLVFFPEYVAAKYSNKLATEGGSTNFEAEISVFISQLKTQAGKQPDSAWFLGLIIENLNRIKPQVASESQYIDNAIDCIVPIKKNAPP